MKTRNFSTMALVGLMATSLAMPLRAASLPTDPLGGKPPAGAKQSVKDLDYQVKYQLSLIHI